MLVRNFQENSTYMLKKISCKKLVLCILINTYNRQHSQDSDGNVRLRHREVLVETVQRRVLRQLCSVSQVISEKKK